MFIQNMNLFSYTFESSARFAHLCVFFQLFSISTSSRLSHFWARSIRLTSIRIYLIWVVENLNLLFFNLNSFTSSTLWYLAVTRWKLQSTRVSVCKIGATNGILMDEEQDERWEVRAVNSNSHTNCFGIFLIKKENSICDRVILWLFFCFLCECLGTWARQTWTSTDISEKLEQQKISHSNSAIQNMWSWREKRKHFHMRFAESEIFPSMPKLRSSSHFKFALSSQQSLPFNDNKL